MPRPLRSLRAVQRCLVLAAVLSSACSKGDSGVAPPKPAAVQASVSSAYTATVGAALAVAPTFTVTDASGNPLGNVAVTVAVASGGGTLVGAPTKSAVGPTSVGTWTLGTTAGANTLTVTITGLTPLTITATGTPGNPTKIVVSSGNAQTALAGAALGAPVAVAVQDQYNNGVPNVTVTFQVTAGGGSITPVQATTNASGIASGTWTLGNKGGAQTASATSGTFTAPVTATIQSSFTLDLRFYGPTMSTAAQAAFTNAANRIRAALVGQISTVSLQGADLSQCGVDSLTGILHENTQGVIIYAAVAPIDGPGKILAQSGPCFIRNSSFLPAVGVMEFDAADIQNYINTGRFESVVLHEMNHVVGFGTIWFDKNLLQNSTYANDSTQKATGSTNPRFMGAGAIASCIATGGSANQCAAGVGVAVEACGTLGTADSHWRERFAACTGGSSNTPGAGPPAFGAELMTGYVEATGVAMPWSTITLSQFQDLGYTVNLLAADPFTVPSLLTMARLQLQAEAEPQHTERVLRPRFTVGGGRIERIQRTNP